MRCVLAITVALLLCALAACGDRGPALAVSNIQVVAPAPGRHATVAYLNITNNGRSSALVAVSSPDFGRAEMHETVIDEGIARMQSRDKVEVGAGETVEFRPQGLHIMLFDPLSAPLPGNSVTLQLEFSSGELLLVDAPLSTRVNPG